ncbi:MAG: hypothetical protein HRT93_09705 [Piscirickettsiaceae bacterium]|nr:hypothetical protein [Piscirickettsiaceae bacterium]
MHTDTLFKVITVLFSTIFTVSAFAVAPPCKGPNKNDPGCPGVEPPPPATAIVDSASVDWLNLNITVRGSDLDTGTTFYLGGTQLDPAPTIISSSELEIPFNDDVAAEVTEQGNYLLNVDGADVLSIFVKSQIVDSAAIGCPCDGVWQTKLGILWDTPNSECLEISGPSVNDTADISGTVLSVPADPSSYPHFPIGASFIPGDPINSVCRLVQVNGDASVDELINLRINETQQTECADLLKANVCATTTQIP